MQKLLITATEALAIGLESRRRHGRIAVARMMIERRRPLIRDIVARGFKALLIALILDRLVVQRGRRRWSVDRLRVGTSEKCG